MIAVVIPCYRVRDRVLDVLGKIGPDVGAIYVVDDACPDGTGRRVESECRDPRVRVLYHERNEGVGGATLTGFRQASRDGARILVKLDGDGQMDPRFIPQLLSPIEAGRADYCKGNRFFSTGHLASMPLVRLLGNSVLSFFSKISHGYWRSMDPTNGFVALHARVFDLLPSEKINRRFFFESDLLFRLSTVRAVVWDVPLRAHYDGEPSSLSIVRAALVFPFLHLHRFGKRLVYNYVLRDFNLASAQLLGAAVSIAWGVCFGVFQWYRGAQAHTFASSGTVMLSALPTILGFQLLLSAIQYDISGEPDRPIHPFLEEAPASAPARRAYVNA